MKNILAITMILLGLGFVGYVIEVEYNKPVNKWKMGDTVCFAESGKRASVNWYSRNPYHGTSYKVISENDLGQMYELYVYEFNLKECE